MVWRLPRRVPVCPKTLPAGTAEEGCQMATYTANYQLHQWVPEDNFLRADFNQDFAKIDAALASLQIQTDGKASAAALAEVQTLVTTKCTAVAGTYTGDGKTSREITLGFQPLAVLVEVSYGKRPAVDYNMNGGLAVRGGSVSHNSTAVSITAAGFRVAASGESNTNNSGESYRYLAIQIQE